MRMESEDNLGNMRTKHKESSALAIKRRDLSRVWSSAASPADGCKAQYFRQDTVARNSPAQGATGKPGTEQTISLSF